MGIKKSLTELKYRMKIRNVLSNATDEEIKITKEECNKELQKRSKNGKL